LSMFAPWPTYMRVLPPTVVTAIDAMSVVD
jgi:hypothetical protein